MVSVADLPPLWTTTLLSTCVLVYFLGSLPIIPQPSSVCLLPTGVLPHFQIYRLFLAPFFHAGFFHLFFNMFTLYFLSTDFENALGTLPSLYATLLIMPATGVVHTLLAYTADALFSTSTRSDCAVGISGFLFTLIVHALRDAETASFFNLFTLSAKIYPLFLVAALSLLSPGLSLLGHLSGVIVGHALPHFEAVTPSPATLEDFASPLKSLALYVPPPTLPLFTSASSSSSSFTAFREVFAAWVRGLSSPPSRSTTAAASPRTSSFSGQGRALGRSPSSSPSPRQTPRHTPSSRHSAPTPPSGRVPPSSRLLLADLPAAGAGSRSSDAGGGES